jgi:hypothetical protein
MSYDFIGDLGHSFNVVSHGITNLISNAFDPHNNGFLSGSFEDFSLGVDKASKILPNVISNEITGISQGVANASTNVLGSLTNQPSFYLLAIGGILGLFIVAFVAVKIGKYI